MKRGFDIGLPVRIDASVYARVCVCVGAKVQPISMLCMYVMCVCVRDSVCDFHLASAGRWSHLHRRVGLLLRCRRRRRRMVAVAVRALLVDVRLLGGRVLVAAVLLGVGVLVALLVVLRSGDLGLRVGPQVRVQRSA